MEGGKGGLVFQTEGSSGKEQCMCTLVITMTHTGNFKKVPDL